MKKIIKFIIVLGLLFLMFQLVVTFFKKSHSVSYEINVNDRKVVIDEQYSKTKEEEYYFFKLTFDNKMFVFDVGNKFNKQKKVIDDIKIYEQNDLICISPIYIKEGVESQVICNVAGEQTSYTSVIEKYNLDDFINSLDNFNKDKYDSYDTSVIIDKMKVYKDNLYDDEYIIVYDYKELIKITKNISDKINFSDYDIYYNEIGRLIDNYYVIPNFENKPEYSSFLIFDILNDKKETIKFNKPISTNVYINGVVDNKLYFFDKSNFIQYEIDPEKKSYRIVGDKTTNGQYYDGTWSTRNIYDFSRQELVFSKLYPIKDNYIKAFETNKYYYYYNSSNEFYKVYKNELDNPIHLFSYDNFEEVEVVNDRIYFINEDTIYRYDDYGIKKIVKNNEFKYNYENIYSVYYK